MNSPLPCNLIQERIVAGEPVDEMAQAHTLSCTSCAAVAAEWLALDSAIADGIDGVVAVPEGFADRVMVSLDDAPATSFWLDRVLGRSWVQRALTCVGLAVAAVNLLRFVFSTLVPAVGLGAIR